MDKDTSTVTDSKPHTKLIEMTKGACHGTCPIYSMTVYNDGTATFDGVRFCEKRGAHIAQLSDFELQLIQQKVALLDMDNYPEKIESMIPDFPSTKITCHEEDGSAKSVWWRNGAPDELSEMSITLDKFRQDLNWKVNTSAPLPAGTIKNQILLQLKEGVNASDFAKQYRAYDLTQKKEIVPNKNYWLFEFNTKKISSLEMLNILHNAEKVTHAEFNKELEQRD